MTTGAGWRFPSLAFELLRPWRGLILSLAAWAGTVTAGRLIAYL